MEEDPQRDLGRGTPGQRVDMNEGGWREGPPIRGKDCLTRLPLKKPGSRRIR